MLLVGIDALARFHRSSLGVAGLYASDCLGFHSSQLGAFVFAQLTLFVIMQVPSGLLSDHVGPRRVLLAGTLLLGSAQVIFGIVDHYGVALLARSLVGIGDALILVSTLRVMAARFEHNRFATATLTLAALGAVGSLAATVPLALALEEFGWVTTFSAAGLVTAGYGVIACTLIPDVPLPSHEAEVEQATGRWKVRRVWSIPAVRLGFWTHFFRVPSRPQPWPSAWESHIW